MKPILTAASLAAGIGVATTIANAQDGVASETARSIINGIILGGKVGPDFYGFVPAHIRSRVTQIGALETGFARARLNRVVNTASPQ